MRDQPQAIAALKHDTRPDHTSGSHRTQATISQEQRPLIRAIGGPQGLFPVFRADR